MPKTWLPTLWMPKRWRAVKFKIPPEHWGREHYLPFTPNAIIESLIDDAKLEPAETETFRRLAERIKRSISLEYHSHHEVLSDLYQRYDPDRDYSDRILQGSPENKLETLEQPTWSIGPCGKLTDREASRELFSEIAASLGHANYRRLSPREIQNAIGVASHWGVRLQIRFSSFRKLEVYGRGDVVTRRAFRSWRHFFRLIERDVPIYQRLVVVFRPRELQTFPEPLDPNRVHIRMFKNVPKADIDMMLPGTQIRLSWLDTGKIGIPTLWGIAMMTSKLAKSLWILALFSTIKILSSFFLIVAVLVATVFYGIKSIFSYTTTKRRYQLNITRSLYYQNLDNNLGALLRIEEEAEQQEICEAILGCFVLFINKTPCSLDEIDRAAEDTLIRLTGIEIDFDVRDSMRDLAKSGLVCVTEQGWQLAPCLPSS
jgi:hypothetical protein